MLEELSTSWLLSFPLLARGAGEDSVSQPGVCVHVPEGNVPHLLSHGAPRHTAGPGSMAGGGTGCLSPSHCSSSHPPRAGCGAGGDVNRVFSGFACPLHGCVPSLPTLSCTGKVSSLQTPQEQLQSPLSSLTVPNHGGRCPRVREPQLRATDLARACGDPPPCLPCTC